jgi:hypothetical protein
MMIPFFLLSASRNGAPPGSSWFKHFAAPGEQVQSENVVNLFFEHDLEPLAQTRRWSDSSQYRSHGQENDLSFSGPCPIALRAGVLAKNGDRYFL